MSRLVAELQEQMTPRSLLGLLGSVLVIGTLAAWLYLLKPAVSEYRALSDERAPDRLARTMGAIETTAAAARAAEAALTRVNEELYGGASRLPAEEVESWIVQRLDEISRSHAVHLVSVAPATPGEVLMFEELPYDVEVSGGYFDLFAWLEDLEAGLRPMVIKRFRMRSDPKSGAVGIELRLVSYRPREDAP